MGAAVGRWGWWGEPDEPSRLRGGGVLPITVGSGERGGSLMHHLHVLHTVGRTPIVELRRLSAKPGVRLGGLDGLVRGAARAGGAGGKATAGRRPGSVRSDHDPLSPAHQIGVRRASGRR
jgi:hypothetical protein